MRSRNIKPGFYQNEILGTLDPITQLLFPGIWMLADKNGRLEDRPLKIKALVFPYRENIDIHRELTVLESLGFIQRYKIGDNSYIQVENFHKHQSPHHTEKSGNIPPPPDIHRELTVNSRKHLRENPPDSLIPDSLIPDSGEKQKPEKHFDENFETFWKQFPNQRKGNREKTFQAWKNAIKRSEPEIIIAGLQAYLRSDEVASGYAKGAAAWLNDDRWGCDYSQKTNNKTVISNAKPAMKNVGIL